MEPATVRIRTVFEDRNMLSKSQRSFGLKRSWLLLKPEHRTISDLASYLIHAFELENACSNGIILSMDGYVLPPFESTCILKDKDIISVSKKRGALSDIIQLANGENSLEVEIVEKQPVHTDLKLLANEEFEKEIGGYESELEEDEADQLDDEPEVETKPAKNKASKKRNRVCESELEEDEADQLDDEPEVETIPAKNKASKKRNGGRESELEEDEAGQSEDAPQVEITLAKSKASKKRKASKELRSPKHKKSKRTTTEKDLVAESMENGTLTNQSRSSPQDRVLSKKKLAKKDKLCPAQGEEDELNTSRIDERSSSSKSSLDAKRSCGLDENGDKQVDALQTPGETTKVPSRSARRKKAKRQWLRLLNQEKKELLEKQLLSQDNQESPDQDNDKFAEAHQRSDQNNDAPCKVVHVFSEKHQKSDQNGDAEEHFVPVVIRPGHIRFKPLGEDDDVEQNNQAQEETFQWNGITSKKKGQKWGMEKPSSSRRNDYRNPSPDSPESSGMVTAEAGLSANGSANGTLDFDKLAPYTSLPKEGDVIAYRLIELSSSWTPELSSFRVGKISRYDSESNNIVLAPVPEYPIPFERKGDEEESELQPDTSLYAEDGTLEISFLSLVDLRSVKPGNLDSTRAVSGAVNGTPADVQNDINANNDRTPAPPKENGGDVWEELSQALNAKKAQLSREDDSSKKESSERRSGSFRGLRSSALGPTMSLLRAQKKL